MAINAENQHNRALSRSQQRAVLALLTCTTVAQAAAEAKVGERTLHRWLREDDVFKAEYLNLRQQAVNDALSALQKYSASAARVLITLANDPRCPHSVRLGAAKSVLEMSLEALNIEVLEARLERLEQVYAEGGAGSNGHYRRGAFPY
jgi:hypothetical protein